MACALALPARVLARNAPYEIYDDTPYMHGLHFVELLRCADVQLELFQPAKSGLGKDIQTLHTQDELYFVASGSAVLNLEGESLSAKVGDALFVPAQKRHHYEQFRDDFAVWVLFFGAERVAP